MGLGKTAVALALTLLNPPPPSKALAWSPRLLDDRDTGELQCGVFTSLEYRTRKCKHYSGCMSGSIVWRCSRRGEYMAGQGLLVFLFFAAVSCL